MLKIERFQRIKLDQEQLGFRTYFEQAIAGIDQRIHIMEDITQTDLDQATSYQRKYKNFENGYFEEFMKIVQEQVNDY